MSFDMNIKATKCGDTFIASILTLSPKSALYRAGFKVGDKVTCEKNTGGDNSIIHIKGQSLDASSSWLAIKQSTSYFVEELAFVRFISSEVGCE